MENIPATSPEHLSSLPPHKRVGIIVVVEDVHITVHQEDKTGNAIQKLSRGARSACAQSLHTAFRFCVSSNALQ